MQVKRIITITTVLVVGIFVSVLLANLFDWSATLNPENSSENSKPYRAAAPLPLDTDFINGLNGVFVTIAEAANPSVVTIFTDRVVTTGSQSPFGDLPEGHPFQDFFGRFFSPSPETERRLRGMGSGVIVSEEGTILTNHHVIREADKIRVMLHGGKKVDGEIIGTDAKSDLAVIKIDENNLKPMQFGNSEELRIGEWVLAIGSPLSENLARTVTSGIVSAKGRSNVGLADYEDFIQTDAAINPGNSGGALVNLRGELVGINTAIATQSGGFQGIGFAVPINMASKIMDALLKEGKVIRGWLGVYIQNIDENLAAAMDLPTTDGALVASVSKASPAEKAGIEPGDVIQTIDGEAVRDVTELRNEIASRAPGSEVAFRILRDGQEKTINVALDQQPEDEATPEMRESSLDKIGFSVQTLDAQLAARLGYNPAEEGVVIVSINQAGAAYQAGLREGDIIKQLNKEPVTTARQFSSMTSDLESGENVLILAKRGQNTFFAAFELD